MSSTRYLLASLQYSVLSKYSLTWADTRSCIIFQEAALRKAVAWKIVYKKEMESKYCLYGPGSSGWTWLKNEEFQEEDVWGVFQGIQDSISRDKTTYMSKGLQYPARSIPNPNKKSYAAEPEFIQRRSTPLSIPDRSKIYGTSCSETYKNSCFWLDAADSNSDESNRGFTRNRWNSDIEEEDHDDGEMEGSAVIPPHVWIAKKIRPSSSVCEGAGRTLKGRDLLSVRNAVLTRTGFLEPKSNRW